MIWLAFALLTGAAALSILVPLARGGVQAAPNAPDISFYKAQVAAIAQDRAAGLVTPADADLALAEAGRNLLQAQARLSPPHPTSLRARRITALLALVFVPIFALGLYLAIGNPDVPDQPLEARLSVPPEQMDMAAAVARIENHLATDPNDGQGWDVLAPIYLQLGRFEDAAKALTQAGRILGDTAERETAIGQAWLRAGQGQVTPEAKGAFEAALKLDPKAVAPRFYLGLAAKQSGDVAQAKAIWSDLLASASKDAPWAPGVAAQLNALAPASPNGSAIAALPAGEQAQAIGNMVAGLDARLSAQGGNLEEWQRLIRAYMVLREPVQARVALQKARQNLSQNSDALKALNQLVQDLGLKELP